MWEFLEKSEDELTKLPKWETEFPFFFNFFFEVIVDSQEEMDIVQSPVYLSPKFLQRWYLIEL